MDFSLFCYFACCKINTSNMSKSTYFTGQPVYSQVIKLLDKAKIQQISHETLGSERYVKRLTGWKHLIIMLFGVLKHFDSLRELEIGMKAETMKLSHLGLDYVVRRSTLAESQSPTFTRVLCQSLCLSLGTLHAIFSGQPINGA